MDLGNDIWPHHEVRESFPNEYQRMMAKLFKVHKPLTEEQARMLDWTLGIGGEAGELTEWIKHHIFSEVPLDKMEVAKELGDIIWYVAAMATVLNINLDDVFQLNICKLGYRYESGGYTHEKSANRVDTKAAFEMSPVYQEIRQRMLGNPERPIVRGLHGGTENE